MTSEDGNEGWCTEKVRGERRMKNDKRYDAFHLGRENRAFELFGLKRDGEAAVIRVWLPGVRSVYVCGDLNGWSRDTIPFLPDRDIGCWSVRLPASLLKSGERYKLACERDGERFLRSDPYSVLLEDGGGRASVISGGGYDAWKDSVWLERRRRLLSCGDCQPMNVYLPSSEEFFDRALGDCDGVRSLAADVKRMGYTHIAPDISRMGLRLSSCEVQLGLCRFVDIMHTCGIGVIADIRGITAFDDSLLLLDGTPLYEVRLPSGRTAPDIRRGEVRSYILSLLTLWVESYRVDGFVFGSPAEVYGSELGDFAEALERLAEAFRDTVMKEHPSLTAVVSGDGILGCTDAHGIYGYDSSLEADTLDYMRTDPLFRKYSHGIFRRMTGRALAAPAATALSLGLGQGGEGGLFESIFGSYPDKLRQLRLLMMYMIALPGKKLLSLGNDADRLWLSGGADMEALGGLGGFLSELNAFYLEHTELWDDAPGGFEWVLADEAEEDLVALERKDVRGGRVLCVFNFSGRAVMGYRLPMPRDIPFARDGEGDAHPVLCWRVAFSSEAVPAPCGEVRVVGGGASVTLPPFGAMYLLPDSRDGRL